jgi:hypothetical protein
MMRGLTSRGRDGPKLQICLTFHGEVQVQGSKAYTIALRSQLDACWIGLNPILKHILCLTSI